MKCNNNKNIKDMYTNKYFKFSLLAIFLAFFGQMSFAQEVVIADTIDAEEAFGRTRQTPWSRPVALT